MLHLGNPLKVGSMLQEKNTYTHVISEVCTGEQAQEKKFILTMGLVFLAWLIDQSIVSANRKTHTHLANLREKGAFRVQHVRVTARRL